LFSSDPARKRLRLDYLSSNKLAADKGNNPGDSHSPSNAQGMDLTKSKKTKLKKKKKRRKHVLNKVELQRAKDFIYSTENEQL
jgi:hypothetical protein